MEAIRDACSKLKSHDLSGAILYTTAEPCPMCLGGILWANIKKVYYGCTIADTDKIGFRDDQFYKTFNNRDSIAEEQDREKCLKLFEDYSALNSQRY